MASFKDTLIDSILSYPTLYSEKWEVCKQFFAVIGNGMEWDENGELVDTFEEKVRTKEDGMDFSSYDKRVDDILKLMKEYSFNDQHMQMQLSLNELEKQSAKHRERFIDLMIDKPCSMSIMEIGKKHNVSLDSYMGYHACYPKENNDSYEVLAQAFCYPENITKDWAEGLLDFVGFWIDSVEKQPEHYSDLIDQLLKVRDDLNLKVYGKTTEILQKEAKELSDRLLKEILAKES